MRLQKLALLGQALLTRVAALGALWLRDLKRCFGYLGVLEDPRAHAGRWPAGWAVLSLGALALCVASADAQWNDTGIGAPALKGSATPTGRGSWTIVGGGDDIWNTSDNCHLLYAWGEGPAWDAIVEVTAFTGPDPWSKCELMVRASDPTVGPRGPDAFISMMACQTTGENIVADQYRSHAGGAVDWKQVGSNPVPVYPGTWMKIHRNGSVFSLYYFLGPKTPGANDWNQYMDIDTSTTTLVGQDHHTVFGTPFPDIVAVGVAVTAHDNSDPTGAIASITNLSATFVTPLPTLTIVNSGGGNVRVSWSPVGDGILMSSPAVFGPNVDFQPIGTANPAVIPVTGSAQYFRVVVDPEPDVYLPKGAGNINSRRSPPKPRPMQNVYSLNVVGYLKLTLNEGYNLVANQLDRDGTGTNNTVTTVFGTNLPVHTTVHTWNPDTAIYSISAWTTNRQGTARYWTNPNLALNPGEGFFVQIPTGAGPRTCTLIGQVLQGTNSILCPAGCSLLSLMAPVSGLIHTDWGYPPAAGDAVYTYIGSDFTVTRYIGTSWTPAEPVLAVGQGFFLSASSTTNWFFYVQCPISRPRGLALLDICAPQIKQD